MFKRILVAHRGVIAVRIIRACHEMGIETVAVYEAEDRGSLHVRLADRCVELKSAAGYLDENAVLRAALDQGADAIHPGYSLLAERLSLILACAQAGITLIGPTVRTMNALGCQADALDLVATAGYPTVRHALAPDGADDAALAAIADRLGYPLIVKSCAGDRGRGMPVVTNEADLAGAVRLAQAQSQSLFGTPGIFFERAVQPARNIGVQILADAYGNVIHLGERDGSLQLGNQKLVEESPAPGLSQVQREWLHRAAVNIGRMFGYRGAGTVEFVVDESGQCYFTEMKPRLAMEHAVSELVTGMDIVQAQIRMAAGEPLSLRQPDVKLYGCAMQCRINAEDPLDGPVLPGPQPASDSPALLGEVRLPDGPHVRVDTYLHAGCPAPTHHGAHLATLTVWGEDRDECVRRVRRALREFSVAGVATNLAYHRLIFNNPHFNEGACACDFLRHPLFELTAPGARPRANRVALIRSS
jgi:acetyl-CoA carboxylase biotin carboxylase subunit